MLQRVAVFAVYCSMFACDAVRCSVLQCAAVSVAVHSGCDPLCHDNETQLTPQHTLQLTLQHTPLTHFRHSLTAGPHDNDTQRVYALQRQHGKSVLQCVGSVFAVC